MKKRQFYMALVIMMFSASVVMAQSTENGRTSFGILGGVNFQNINGTDNSGDKLANEMIIGYHAGFNVQIPLVPNFYLQPGLLFTTKGAKTPGGLLTNTNTYTLSYIELPLNFVYKGALGRGYVMLGFGPYAAYGIMGKVKSEGGLISTDPDIVFKNVVESGDPILTAYYKALDAGANLFVGFETAGGVFLQLNTQLGMLNIHPEDNRLLGDNTSVFKNTGYGLSLGFRF